MEAVLRLVATNQTPTPVNLKTLWGGTVPAFHPRCKKYAKSLVHMKPWEDGSRICLDYLRSHRSTEAEVGRLFRDVRQLMDEKKEIPAPVGALTGDMK